jgi:small subunit ribosomal protein S19
MVEYNSEQYKKEVLFRGKKLEELKKLDTREFSKHLKARERRSVLRNFDVIESFVKSCEKKKAKNKPIRTHKRDLVIVPAFVGMSIGVYNGKEFLTVKIIEGMLGHRFGEFSPTRRAVKHGAAGVGATKSSAKLSVK